MVGRVDNNRLGSVCSWFAMKDSQLDENGLLAPTFDSDAPASNIADSTRTNPAVKPQVNAWQFIPLASNAKQTIPLSPLTLKPNKTLVLGRASDCDLVIGIKPISRRHAEFCVNNDSVVVKDLGSANGTFINDNRVKSGELKHGDYVKFEKLSYQVVAPESQRKKTLTQPSRPEKHPQQTKPVTGPNDETILQAVKQASETQSLQIIHGYLLGLTPPIDDLQLALSGEKIRIGRDSSNDLVISHKSVSSKHAELNYVDGQWRLDDLKSTNGCFINGEKISHAMIKPRQLINIGQIKLVYNLNSIQEEFVPQCGINSGINNGVIQDSIKPESIKFAKLSGNSDEDKNVGHSLPRPGLIIALGVAITLLVVSWLPRWFDGVLSAGSIDHIRGLSEQISADMNLDDLELAPLWDNAQIPSDRSATTPAIGDVNQDNEMEIVVADAQGFITVFQGKDGKKIFDIQLPHRIIAPPMIGDINLDGQAEIIVADNGGRVHKINGNGELDWSSEVSLNLGPIIQRPLLIDVNEDQFMDVVVATPNLGLVALDGSRNGWLLWQSKQLLRGRISTLPLIADLNRDGHSEFVVTTDQGQVSAISVEQGQINLLWQQQLNPISFSAPTLVGSNRRENTDSRVILLTDQSELIALSGRTGSVKWRKSVGGYAFAALNRGDCNRDGDEDVVLQRYDGNVLCVRGDSGTKLWQQDLYTSVQSSAAVIDLTLDGVGDFVITDTRGQLHILDGANGEPLIQSFSIPNADNFSSSPVIGDFSLSAHPALLMVSQNGLIHSFKLNRHSDRGKLHWSHFLADKKHGYRHQ